MATKTYTACKSPNTLKVLARGYSTMCVGRKVARRPRLNSSSRFNERNLPTVFRGFGMALRCLFALHSKGLNVMTA